MLKILDTLRKATIRSSRSVFVSSSLTCEKKEHKRKVKETVELVTLVDQNDKILGLKPKPETLQLAKKLNLSLERVYDTKYGKVYPAYKMVAAADLLKAEKKATTLKTLKKLALNPRISDNDLKIKAQTIEKWIDKNCEVHIAINKSETEPNPKGLFNKVQDLLKDKCRIIDVRDKETALKFIVLPQKTISQPPKKEQKLNDQNS